MLSEYMNEYVSPYYEMYLELIKSWGISPELSYVILLVALWLVLYIGRGLSFFRFLMRWFQRLLVIAGLVWFGFWLYCAGMEHKIYLDNKPINGNKSLELVNVSINGGESAELMPRDRDMRKAVGSEFELKAEILDEDGKIENTITRNITIGLSKDIMISLPSLVSGSGDFVIPAPR